MGNYLAHITLFNIGHTIGGIIRVPENYRIHWGVTRELLTLPKFSIAAADTPNMSVATVAVVLTGTAAAATVTDAACAVVVLVAVVGVVIAMAIFTAIFADARVASTCLDLAISVLMSVVLLVPCKTFKLAIGHVLFLLDLHKLRNFFLKHGIQVVTSREKYQMMHLAVQHKVPSLLFNIRQHPQDVLEEVYTHIIHLVSTVSISHAVVLVIFLILATYAYRTGSDR